MLYFKNASISWKGMFLSYFILEGATNALVVYCNKFRFYMKYTTTLITTTAVNTTSRHNNTVNRPCALIANKNSNKMAMMKIIINKSRLFVTVTNLARFSFTYLIWHNKPFQIVPKHNKQENWRYFYLSFLNFFVCDWYDDAANFNWLTKENTQVITTMTTWIEGNANRPNQAKNNHYHYTFIPWTTVNKSCVTFNTTGSTTKDDINNTKVHDLVDDLHNYFTIYTYVFMN